MSEYSVTRERTLEAPVERVFRTLTEPGEVVRVFPLDEVHAEMRVGGAYVIHGCLADHPFTDHGVSEVLEPPRRFRYHYWSTNHGTEDVPENRMAIDYLVESAGEGRSRLTLSHENLLTAERQAMMEGAWDFLLECLRGHVESPPGDDAPRVEVWQSGSLSRAFRVSLHDFLDHAYGPDGDARLAARLEGKPDLEVRSGRDGETALHAATRRRRLEAVRLLLEAGAEIDARDGNGKTAYAHAHRRGFTEVAHLLEQRGASRELAPADRLAVALTSGDLEAAHRLLDEHPGIARTGNPAEDRLLADLAGREATEPVKLLVEAGADLTAPGLDDGTPLHQAAWFGQPESARILVAARAPLEIFESTHQSSPLGWAVHGSRYSGGAEERQEAYVEIVRLLLDAGAKLEYPEGENRAAFRERLLRDATPAVREILEGC